MKKKTKSKKLNPSDKAWEKIEDWSQIEEIVIKIISITEDGKLKDLVFKDLNRLIEIAYSKGVLLGALRDK